MSASPLVPGLRLGRLTLHGQRVQPDLTEEFYG